MRFTGSSGDSGSWIWDDNNAGVGMITACATETDTGHMRTYYTPMHMLLDDIRRATGANAVTITANDDLVG